MTGQVLPDPARPDLRAIKAVAKAQLGQLPGVQGFGLGDGCLRIYVLNDEVKAKLPREFGGVPVEIVVSGDIVAQR